MSVVLRFLAVALFESVRDNEVNPGRDGITYLIHAMAAGIKTPLTQDYQVAVLQQTGSASLA